MSPMKPPKPAPEAVDGQDEDEDPAVALKKELRLKPGEWYVIHSYAGYENLRSAVGWRSCEVP